MSAPLPIRALLVTEHRSAADALSLALSEPAGAIDRPVLLTETRSPAEALTRASTGTFELAFIDLAVEGVHPLDVLARYRGVAEHAPMIVLSPDETIGAQAILSGAYDQVVRSLLEAGVIRRAVRSVLERRRLERALLTLEHNDSLTGLLNRRGFHAAAEPRLRQGWRGKGTWVLFADIDGLRRINDRLGHTSGNEALIAVAASIKGSIRGSDLAARTGGDEFCVMLVDAGEDAARAVAARMQRKIEAFVQQRRVPLAVTLGSARCEPQSVSTLDELIRIADEQMRKARDAGRAMCDAGLPL